MTEYRKDLLANGLRLVTIEMPHLHSADMACYVQVGGRDETAGLAGISHFLEHMIFRGTADYPNSFLLERAFEAIGGAVNASTDVENTCYHSRLHPRYLPEAARLFASMLTRPLLTDVEVERRIILEEALDDLNEKGDDISPDNLTARLLWPDHPLSQPTIGTGASINAISEADLRRHHAGYYTPDNTVIVVAGNIRHDQARQEVEAAFGHWQGQTLLQRQSPQTVPCSQPETVWVKDSDSQINLQLAFRTPGRNHADTVPLRVLRWILSWGGASRLMLRLREQLGLTYHVEAGLSMLADCGCFSIELAVTPENLCRAVEEVLGVVRELCAEPVPDEELKGVLQAYLFDLEFSQDNPDAMLTRYGWGELTGYLRTVEQDRAQVMAVTPAVLQQAASKVFSAGNLKLAVVGPWKANDRKQVKQVLEKF
ncbi:M16 family metallopeptidase [Trichloromonas sp.]|uniref:M16 family metallopeptidase n=1 Tax=Trichloromonas sp. TaxID=3069249 RepID=UPI003D81A93F